MDILLKPVRIATSRPARRTYLNTFLFVVSSVVLLGLAIVAYVSFYWNYVPQMGVERTIHLQYSDGLHPYGIVKLDRSLVSQQPYDIAISLHLPRSPQNVAQGNFMLSLALLAPSYTPPPPFSSVPLHDLSSPTALLAVPDTISVSRRPAILTYTSRLVSLSERFIALPLYVLGIRKESELLHIPMAERQSFEKGWNKVPEYALLELQAGQEVQVYDVDVKFTAIFGGLRWLMWKHQIISFFIFTGAFWTAEVIFMGLGWASLRIVFSGPKPAKLGNKGLKEDTEGEDANVTIKDEPATDDDPDLSDTPRTFPTYGRQQPLKYEPKVKDEDIQDVAMDETAIQPLIAEADDEDEDEGRIRERGRDDSGIGTSFSEGGEGIARRRSRGGKVSKHV